MRRAVPGSCACLGIGLALIGACRPNVLNLLSGQLAFSSPDDPAAVTKLDAGVIQIDFGPVAVGSTRTLTLATVSLAGSVTLGALTPLQPDSEFSLPFISGTSVGATPSQITAAFSPTSLGDKTAVYGLAYTTPAGGAVTIELTGEGVPSGLTVTPNPVDFGNVELNRTQPVSLTIANNTETSATLTLSSLEGPNPFEFSLGALSSSTVAPGAPATLTAVFGPLVIGAASASFTINPALSDGTASLPITVSLGGTGVESWLQVTSPLDFGYVPPGHTLVRSAEVKNGGSFGTLHLVTPAPSITQPSGSAVFTLQPLPALPLAIGPGQTAQLPVSFAPQSRASYSGTLSLATDDPGSMAPIVQLEGHGGGPEISCLSPLDLGPVPLGHSISQHTICTNAGTYMPDGSLLIAQSSLSTDNQAFVASLALPDGGLGGPDFSVSLAPGQSEAVEVTFQPDDAGIYTGRLLVPTNDLSDFDAGVTLTGEGIVPGHCSVELLPEELSFGEVPSGDVGILPFEINNTGQNLCVLTGVSLGPRSDPAFSLPGGDPGYQLLSYPGDSDNPVGLPTSVSVDVQFAPTAAEAAATGRVDVTIANAMPSDQTVSLIATSAASCLSIEPPGYDFGLVGFSPSNLQVCLPVMKTFVAQNDCPGPVTIDTIDLSSGTDPTPQYSLESNLQLPLVIAPGGSVFFQASFVPTGVGAKLGAITVGTSALSGAPFLLTLQGDAETTGSRTDTFTVAAPSKQLDLLWVLDEDDDAPGMGAIASVLPQLVDVLDDAGIDYQMAVTSTDTCDAGRSDDGFFEPCDHCLSTTSADPLFITPSTAAPAIALSERFALFDVPPQIGLCEKVNGDEHFFDSIAGAFAPALLSGHNSGFVRDGANLVVMVGNSDGEDDARGAGAGGPYLTSLAQLATRLWGLKADPRMVSVSYINYGGQFALLAPRMTALVGETGGTEIDGDLVAWETLLLDFVVAPGRGSFHLSSTPAGQIEVYVDGVATKLWLYDSYLNEITFPATNLPAAGSTITVTYDVGCP